ncbi:MAG: tRNA isopentenyl-2-thiomethyl-A-37 hydroxylase MiaE [bacterium]
MLSLAVPTDGGWFDRIADHLDVILIDHCHLEKRAASNALNLIFRYTGRDGLARELSEVVKEEMDHFTQMLDIFEARNIEFVRLAIDVRIETFRGCDQAEPAAFRISSSLQR